MGILPIASSLVLHVAAYVKDGYLGMSNLRTILTFFVGGFAAAWGYLFCRASYFTYSIAVSSTHNEHIVGIDGYLLQIYSMYGVYGAIWLLLGTFLIGASLYSLLRRK
jgi:hypothetical protein